MSFSRKHVQAVGTGKHGTVEIAGPSDDKLPSNVVYLDPASGRTFDGRDGKSLADLPSGVIEVPRTTWFSRCRDEDR